MARKNEREPDYLITRKDSPYFYLQLIVPKDLPSGFRKADDTIARKYVRSTFETDREKARELTREEVTAFKRYLSAGRALQTKMGSFRLRCVHKQEPGVPITHDDGTVSHADEEFIFTMQGAKVVGREPNIVLEKYILAQHLNFDGSAVQQTKWPPTWTKEIIEAGGLSPLGFLNDLPLSYAGRPVQVDYKGKPKDATSERDIDAAIIDVWIASLPKPKRLDAETARKRYKDEALQTLQHWRTMKPGITMANADHEDALALADYLGREGPLKNSKGEPKLKQGSVKKKISFLRAAFFVAKKRPKMFPELVGRDNPFSGAVPQVDDAQDKVMLDDADVALIKAHLHELALEERIAMTWCLAMGCRLSEPFEIRREMEIDGFRCIRYGTKNPATDRTEPLPPILLELHPKTIDGPIFTKRSSVIGKRLNAWMKELGITDPSKTLHSARHRAAYKLRRFEDALRHECLGHQSRSDPSETYGRFPMDQLFEALAAIWPEQTIAPSERAPRKTVSDEDRAWVLRLIHSDHDDKDVELRATRTGSQ